MDIFLGKVTQQAMNYAIRSGITITASYAIKQSIRLLKTVEGSEKSELQDLQERLDHKIKIISPAIDMIELISARGNTSLESAVTLTKRLRSQIAALGQRLSKAANVEESIQQGSAKPQVKVEHRLELKAVAQAIRKLLGLIEDAVPLINLAITASGASLSSSLPSSVSPSRLLQASTFLTAGDSQYIGSPHGTVQIGPTFVLSLYMLFQGHARPQSEDEVRDSTWKEVIHKAVVTLIRVPMESLFEPSDMGIYQVKPAKLDEYAYQLRIIEDLDDGRVHTFDDEETQPGSFDQVTMAGIREAIPIHELSKIFYADTGKILNIGNEGEANAPVLLLKRDLNAVPPRRMAEGQENSNFYDGVDNEDLAQGLSGNVSSSTSPNKSSTSSPHSNPADKSGNQEGLHSNPSHLKFPQDLDPEWMAFEVYVETEDSEDESDAEPPAARPAAVTRAASVDASLSPALSHLKLDGPSSASSPAQEMRSGAQHGQAHLPPIRTSLSLLEVLLRLISLQQFQQTPHLSIPDELLTFFLSEAGSTGVASNDVQERRRLREAARRHVGFDPYDESPVKRRGEEYQYRGGDDSESWSEGDHLGADERYGRPIDTISPRSARGIESLHHWNGRNDGQQRRHLVRDGTPETPSSSSRKHSKSKGFQSTSASPTLAKSQQNYNLGAEERFRSRTADTARKGSPLARPSTSHTDEGIGTSPLIPSSNEGKET